MPVMEFFYVKVKGYSSITYTYCSLAVSASIARLCEYGLPLSISSLLPKVKWIRNGKMLHLNIYNLFAY